MKTLKLFNSVQSKPSKQQDVYVSEEGYVIEPAALWAKEEIVSYYKKEKLNGNELNKTFHKSWEKIKNSSRVDLLIEQIRHYISTYGSNFQDEIYIPNETLEVPETDLKFKVIKALSKEELTKKCLSLLESGMALKEETINDILSILVDELNYAFTGNETIKNKEAVIKIADLYGVLPKDTGSFLRYIIYKATGQSLLIKDKKTIAAIKKTNFNPTVQFKKFGLEKLAENFNRYKPLFLAFKGQSKTTINKISKLSKTLHRPLVANPLNNVTNTLLTDNDLKWLNNATPYALFKALSACYSRREGQNQFLYRIRNGASWLQEGTSNKSVVTKNYQFLLQYLKTRIDLSGTKIYLPTNVEYALPTSEKMFVGNIPTGTKFYGERLAAGIYWKDSWGARDIDLSGLNETGKVGWNARYTQGDADLMYSGDMTSAPNGAVEYLYANKNLRSNTLITVNIFNGKEDCGYQIVVGQGDNIDRNYMMNPNQLLLQVKCNSIQGQNVLGVLFPEEGRQCFLLLNFGAGHTRVSVAGKPAEAAVKALYQQWKNPLRLKDILLELGADLVETPENADVDLSVLKLQKDTFIGLFKK